MTVSTTEPRITYAGDGSTTSFSIPFDFTGDSEVVVNLLTDSTNNVVLQTNPTEYSISGTNVVMVTAPASGETLIIELGVTESQATDYVANDAFPAETHEAALDKLTRWVKQLQVDFDYRAVKLPVNTLTSTTATDTDIVANNIFRINAAGDGIELATIAALTGGGDEWGDPVDSSITLDTDSAYDFGTNTVRLANMYADNLYGTLQTAAQGNITSVGTLTTLSIDNITINGNTIEASSGDVVIGSSDNIDMSGNTSYLRLPQGTTAQRTGSNAGEFRYNTSDNKLEFYTGSAWSTVSTGSAGQAWSDPIDSAITLDTDSTYDIGTTSVRIKDLYADNLYGVVAEAAQTSITSLGTLTTLTVDNITINGNDISSGSGDITFSPTGVVDMTASTDYFLPPKGTTAQRTGSTAGETRYNTTTNKLEYYNGSSWIALDASGSAGLVLLSAQSASASSTIDFDNLLDSTYDAYVLIVSGAIVGTDGAELRMRVGTGATPTYQTSSYTNITSGASTYMDVSADIGIGNASGESYSGKIMCYDPASTDTWTNLAVNVMFARTTGSVIRSTQGGTWKSITAVTSLRIYPSSGTITSGEFRLYGIVNS
jgi:hypothetical protein